MRRLMWSLGGALALAAPVEAQQRLDRAQRPVAGDPVPYRFPRVETRTLSNGLQVYVVERRELPVVAVRAVIVGGAALDPEGKEGLFNTMLQMLPEGTAHRTAEELADAFGAMGNPVSPVAFTTVTRNFEASLAIMAEMLRAPAFPEASLARLKGATIGFVQRARETPTFIPSRIFAAALYGRGHAYERVQTAETLASITRDDVVNFHREYVRPQNVRLVVVGNVSAAEAMRQAERAFGSWERGGSDAARVVAPVPATGATTIYLFDRPGAPQSVVYVGQMAPGRASPDFHALEAMNVVFGALGSSRLAQSLRERHGFTYGASSGLTWRPADEPATFFSQSTIATAKTDSALALWLEQLRGLREQPPTAAELELARSNRVGTLPAQIATYDALAVRLVDMVTNGLPLDFYDRYVAGISRLTADDVFAMARRVVAPDRSVIVVAGDRAAIEAGLRGLGLPVVVVDERGEAIR